MKVLHAIKMTNYIKDQDTAILAGPQGCEKSHLILDLIEKEYNIHFDYIIIICPILKWNKTYHTEVWIRYDGNVWLIEPKGKLYQWIEKFSLLFRNTIYNR